MADESSGNLDCWPVESIPDEDRLYMRVHKQYVEKSGEPMPSAFQDRDGGMSTDWSRYATSDETLSRARKPDKNGVLWMGVGEARSIPNLVVEHTPFLGNPLADPPQPPNRAHTDVIGEKEEDPEVRLKLKRISTWTILPPK